jgi:hypothetical protein
MLECIIGNNQIASKIFDCGMGGGYTISIGNYDNSGQFTSHQKRFIASLLWSS